MALIRDAQGTVIGVSLDQLTGMALDVSGAPVQAAVAPPDGETLPDRAVVVLAHEGEQTADQRLVDEGALSWRTPPLTLTMNHDPDQVAGRLDPIGRVNNLQGLTVDNFAERVGTSGTYVVAMATFDLGYDGDGNLLNPDAVGREAARMVDGGFLKGISMEVGNDQVEWECLAEDEDGFCTEMLMRLLSGEIGAATIAPFQAIEGAQVVDVADPEAQPIAASAGWWRCPEPDARPITASVVAELPDVLPADAFTMPEPDEYTPLWRDGYRIGFHLAPWDVCHVGITDYCQTCPSSSTGYAYFHQVPVTTDTGELMVGLLTTDQLHVDLTHDDGTPIGADEARRLAYENPAARAAYLRVVDGVHGPWACGVLHPNVSDAQLARITDTAVSGDWRPIEKADGTYVGTELISISAVNTRGFPHARALAASAADGTRQTLAVVGSLAPSSGCGCGGQATAAAAAPWEARMARVERIVSTLGLDDQALASIATAMRA